MKRSWWWVPLAFGAAVVVGGVGWSLIPADNGRHLPPTRARAYRDVSACLLTGGRGIADPQAAAAWSGMEDASATTHARVTYLAVPDPAGAAPYEIGRASCRERV